MKQPINLLPIGLTHLTIYPNSFDEYIETIPDFITHLYLRGYLTKKIKKIPDSIQQIVIYDEQFKSIVPEKYHNIIKIDNYA